jgi:hypothetical protein
MGLISSIQDALGMNPGKKGFKKGEKFEEYTESFFPEEDYDLLEKTHNTKTNDKRFVESSMKPDFKFRDKKTRKSFYVESKYRSALFNNKVEWCKDLNQLKRYQEYNKECPVFILIGFGGKSSYPDEVYLIPLAEAKYTGLYPSVLKKYVVEFDGAVTSRELWNR